MHILAVFRQHFIRPFHLNIQGIRKDDIAFFCTQGELLHRNGLIQLKNSSISVFISAPVAVPFGASFAPASALSALASAPASALPVSASAPDSALFAPDSASALFVPDSPRLSFASAFDGEAFNADFFNVASFSAVSAVSSASVSAPIRCSELAANACGCHSHVFHINIADNAAAKIRFDFFLIPFSSH
ncbi:MAG: hypothetical protein ACLUD2_15805 [Clostridium sp.]